MPTDKDTIDSYDEHAEAWARRMRSGKSKSHSYLEKPAMLAALPPLDGLDVLCIGCGSGEECQVMKDKGAGRVVGTDVSKGLIEQAKYAFPEVEFETMDMERLSFLPESFDVVYSSLVLHYVPDWRPTLAAVKKVLKPGGTFLFSTHHPIRFASETSKSGDVTTSLLGYEVTDGSGQAKIHGDYMNARPVTDQWFDKVKVTYHHKPFAGMITELLESGLRLEAVIEPRATPAALKLHPDFYAVNQKIPLFMIFKLMKPN